MMRDSYMGGIGGSKVDVLELLLELMSRRIATVTNTSLQCKATAPACSATEDGLGSMCWICKQNHCICRANGYNKNTAPNQVPI